MDMSKAFDAVNRETLVEVLRTIMDPDELHMTKILMKVFSYASERNWREVHDKHMRAAVGLSKSSRLHPLPIQSLQLLTSIE